MLNFYLFIRSQDRSRRPWSYTFSCNGVDFIEITKLKRAKQLSMATIRSVLSSLGVLLMYCRVCLVPRPHYSARPKRFGSRGHVFPDRSPRVRHRNELTERDWENAVQGLGNCRVKFHVVWSALQYSACRILYVYKLNVLFLTQIVPSPVTRTRSFCEGASQRIRANKLTSEIISVGDE